MSTREKLLADIETFLARTGMKPTHLGIAVRDRAIVTRLRAGADIQTSTADKIRAYMASALESQIDDSHGDPGESATV